MEKSKTSARDGPLSMARSPRSAGGKCNGPTANVSSIGGATSLNLSRGRAPQPGMAEQKPLLTKDGSDEVDVGAPKASNLQSAANIIKSFVGVGILGLPYALLQGGIWVRLPCAHEIRLHRLSSEFSG